MNPKVLPRSVLTYGFPLLIAIAYTNVSDVLLRRFGIPSVLQATVLVLAVVVILARKELRPLEVISHPLTIGMAVYCAVLFVSSAWADDLAWADFRTSEAVKGLIVMILGAALMSTWRRVRVAAATLAVVAGLLAAISVAQIATHSTNDLGGLAQIQTGNIYGDVAEARAAGPVSDPNFYGQILLMTLPIAAFLAVRSRLFWLAALAIFAGVLVTYSRGAMLSVLAMCLLLPFVINIKRGLILKAAVAAVLLMAVAPVTVVRRLHTVTDIASSESRDASVDKRKLLLGVGLRMFEDSPIFGVGAGNFGKHYARYANEIGSSAPQYDDPGERQFPHSLYVELAAENGLVGLAAFATAMAIAFSVGRRRPRRRGAAEAALSRGHGGEGAAAPLSDEDLLATSIALALAGYLISSLFLHSAYQRYLWLLLAFIPAIARLSRRDEEVTA